MSGAPGRAGLRQAIQSVEHIARLHPVGIRVPGQISRRIVAVGRRRRGPALRHPVVLGRRQPVHGPVTHSFAENANEWGTRQ